MGQICPATDLSWVYSHSLAFRPPHTHTHFCLSSLFRVTFLPYSPFIRDRQRAKEFHKFLSSIFYVFHPRLNSLASCPVLPSSCSHKIARSYLPSGVSPLREHQHYLTVPAHQEEHGFNRPEQHVQMQSHAPFT